MATCNETIGVTVETFKNYFARRMSFLPIWSSSQAYLEGDIIYYSPNNAFYRSLANANTALPTDDTKWQIFQNTIQYIYDEDISNAFREACINFNPDLFPDNADAVLAYLYLSAHFLIKDLQNNGLNASYFGNVQSRSVGNVSESYVVPEWLSKDPFYSFLGSTWYGVKYAYMIRPRMIGAMYAVFTGTNAA